MNTAKNVLAVIGASVVWFALLGAIGIGHFEMCYAPNERACNIKEGEK